MSQEADSVIGGGSLRDVISSIRDTGVTISATENGGVMQTMSKLLLMRAKGAGVMRNIRHAYIIRYTTEQEQVDARYRHQPTLVAIGVEELVAFYKGLVCLKQGVKQRTFQYQVNVSPAKEIVHPF